MDFGFTEEQRLLRDSVRKLMQKHAPPEYVRQHDRERTYPEELFQACAEAGLLALPFPEEYGGARRQRARHGDRRRGDRARLRRSGDGLYAAASFAASTSCAWRRRSRSVTGCRNFSPARSSSRSRCRRPTPAPTSAPMRTTAVHDGNEWVIDGQKLWASTRRRQEQRHQSLCEDRPQGALPPGHVVVPGRQRHARARPCASSTCSAAAPPAPMSSPSTTCACRPTA